MVRSEVNRTGGRVSLAAVLAALVAFVLAFCLCAPARPALASGPVEGLVEQADTLSTAVSQLEDAVKGGDSEQLRACTQAIQDTVDAMRSSLADGLWSAASFIPFVGGDVTKARDLLDEADDLVDNALAPLSAALQEYPLTSLVSDGALNTDALTRYAEVVAQVQPVFERVAAGIDGLGSFTVPQLNDALQAVRGPLDQLSEALATYKPLVEKLPNLIGANGARTYLIIAQNNAEIRATGGFPGAWGTVTLDGGQVYMGDFTTLASKRDVAFDITDEELELFGAGMAVNPANLNMTPDFPRAASLLADAWLAYTGQSVDGVIALDPRFLQDMLALTGGVITSDGTVVDGTNAAQALLSDVYWRYGNDGVAQDAFFAEVAGLAAEQVMGNIADASFSDLFDTLRRDVNAGRLLVWSADDDVEAALAASSIAGALPSDPAEPVLGVYVNDNTWAKMNWYLGLDTQVEDSHENADGTVTYQVETTLSNAITVEEAAAAPDYVTGNSPSKRSPDDMFVQPLLVAPAGGSISGLEASGTGTASLSEATLYGHGVWKGDVNLAAGESVTLSYEVTVAADAAPLEVHQTPTAQGE